MKQKYTDKTGLPLIRLNLVYPLIEDLERQQIDSRFVLSGFNLSKNDVLTSDMFIPAPVMYGIVEQLAGASGDPHFGVHAGERLDPFSWQPLSDAAALSTTIGEFLLRFMISAMDHESSATYILETKGKRTTFHEKRKLDGNIRPRHNDGFTIAYFLTLFSRILGENWQGNKVLARLCDPGVLPTGYLGVRVAVTDTLGPSITFPCRWLVLPLAMTRGKANQQPERLAAPPPGKQIDALAQVLQRHIHEFDLTVQRVAEICGYSKRTLSRKLQSQGTSIRKEITKTRRKRAEWELTHSSRPIAEIAHMVGYEAPTVFSRAFRRWTGQSPRQFRLSQLH